MTVNMRESAVSTISFYCSAYLFTHKNQKFYYSRHRKVQEGSAGRIGNQIPSSLVSSIQPLSVRSISKYLQPLRLECRHGRVLQWTRSTINLLQSLHPKRSTGTTHGDPKLRCVFFSLLATAVQRPTSSIWIASNGSLQDES